MAVRVDLNISLTASRRRPTRRPRTRSGPTGRASSDAFTATRTFRARVLHDPSSGLTGVDDEYAQAYFAEVGAEIIGAGMFGLHAVATIPTGAAGGATSLRSMSRCSCSPTAAPGAGDGGRHDLPLPVRDAPRGRPRVEAAGGKDVGSAAARPWSASSSPQDSSTGSRAIVPILLGRGVRLWDDLRGFEDGYRVTSEVAPSGITHLTFAR